MPNPLQTNIGNAGVFNDNRTPVQDNSNLVSEQERRRKLGVDLQDKLGSIESNAKFMNAIGMLGIKLGEIQAINNFYGAASNEQEAIGMISAQGEATYDALASMTELSQARTSGSLSYEQAQNKMSLLLRRAKTDNPLFAYVYDKAAAQFITGSPSGVAGNASGGSGAINGTLTSLSVAEQAQRAYVAKGAKMKIEMPWLSDRDVAINISAQAEREQQQLLWDHELKSAQVRGENNTFKSSRIANMSFSVIDTQMANAYSSIQQALYDNPGGLNAEQRTGLLAQVNGLRANLTASVQQGVEAYAENDSSFVMDVKTRTEISQRIDREIQNLEDHINDEHFEANMKSQRESMEAATQVYFMKNYPEWHFMSEFLFGGDTDKVRLAMQSSETLKAMIESDPTMKAMLEDSVLNTKEGAAVLAMGAMHRVFDGPTLEGLVQDVLLTTANISGNEEVAEAAATKLATEEGKQAITRLAEGAASDPDVALVYTHDPAFVSRSNESPQYATTVVKPMIDAAIGGAVNSILLDNNGRNPELNVSVVGFEPSSGAVDYTSAQGMSDQYKNAYAGFHLNVDGVTPTQQRHLDEQFESLILNPNVMGVSPRASMTEKKDAALDYINKSIQELLPEVVPVDEATEDVTGGTGVPVQDLSSLQVENEDMRLLMTNFSRQIGEEQLNSALEGTGYSMVDGTLIYKGTG